MAQWQRANPGEFQNPPLSKMEVYFRHFCPQDLEVETNMELSVGKSAFGESPGNASVKMSYVQLKN